MRKRNNNGLDLSRSFLPRLRRIPFQDYVEMTAEVWEVNVYEDGDLGHATLGNSQISCRWASSLTGQVIQIYPKYRLKVRPTKNFTLVADDGLYFKRGFPFSHAQVLGY